VPVRNDLRRYGEPFDELRVNRLTDYTKMASLRLLTDGALLEQCRVEAFRGPGPGGQKKNKTSSAVRVVHLPTGISAMAGESRSQHRNKAMAIWRLRHKIALEVREEIDLSRWPQGGVVEVSRKSEDYPAAIGVIFDVLQHCGWSVSDAGKMLGVSTGQLVGFLSGDTAAWAELNRQRRAKGLRVLNA
jgi:RF-1 domain